MANAGEATSGKLAVRAGLRRRREGGTTTIDSEEAVRALAAVGELLDAEVVASLGPHLVGQVAGGDVLVVGEGSRLTSCGGGFELVEEVDLILDS